MKPHQEQVMHLIDEWVKEISMDLGPALDISPDIKAIVIPLLRSTAITFYNKGMEYVIEQMENRIENNPDNQ